MRTIQIRNVPDDLHEDLRVRAAKQNTSLSDYVLRQLEEIGRLPHIADVLRRDSARMPGLTTQDIVDVIRAGRDRE